MALVNYSFDHRDGVLAVLLKGSLDASNSVQFGTDLKKELEKEEVKNIAFEVSALDNMASAGLRVVMVGIKHCQSRRGKFYLVAPSQNVRQLMRISNIGMFMEIVDSMDAIA